MLGMEPRLSFLTLVVRDIEASRAFYVDGLGWPAEFEAPGEIVMVRVGAKLVLSLWDERSARDEIGPIARGNGAPPFTLAHNVAQPGDVDKVIAEAVAAGAELVVSPVHREWGGYSGYVADPDGYRWEIAWNPGAVGQSIL
jgi:Predicted lactoylglutathione lyase